MPICQASITTGGVITIIDERKFIGENTFYDQIRTVDSTTKLSLFIPAEQMFANTADLGLTTGGTGSFITTASGKRQILRLSAPTTTGGLTFVHIGGGTAVFQPGEDYRFKFITRRQTASVGGTVDTYMGMRVNLTTGQQDGIYFRMVNGGNWFLVCRNGGTETTVDMGVAPSTNYLLLELRISGNGTSVQGFVNNILTGAAITTNIPPATTAHFGTVFNDNRLATVTTGLELDLAGIGFKGDFA